MKKLKKRAVHMKYPDHLNLAKGGAVKMAAGGMTPTAVQGNLIDGGTGGVNTTAATGAGQTGLIPSISDALGVQNQFQAQSAKINPGTNVGQLNTAYGGVQGALGQQGQIANQLAPQVGSAVNNQNMLANQYADMTQGRGPNPAQAQLNQATGENVAAQAALMAGQRGASANAGLIARQAAQQGAATQQQAIGQAATLGAQQQIAAQQNLAALANNQVNQAGSATGAVSSGQQNEQNILQNANTSANNAAVGMQSNLNNVNSQTAAANQNMNANTAAGVGKMLSNVPVIGSLFGATGGEVGRDFGAVKMDDGGGVNIPATASLPANTANFAESWGGSSGGGDSKGGGGLGGMMSMAALLANGGQISANPLVGNQTAAVDTWAPAVFNNAASAQSPEIGATASLAPTSTALTTMAKTHKDSKSAVPENAGQGPTKAAEAELPYAASFAAGGRAMKGPYRSHVANFLAGGGKTGTAVKAIVSPKEVYLSPDQVHKVVHEGADPMKIGHKFPGTDKVKGRDSRKNDVIPTTLEDGGCVIPVHITTHKQASERGRKFVARTMAKHMKRPSGAK